MNFIEIKDVVKQYDGHLALDHVSMDVPESIIYGLLGPNGAGKTSLIRIINMITKPDSGEVLLGGKALQPDDVAQIGSEVPNFGTPHTGPKLREGMVIAIEPMLTLGHPDIYVHDNDW
ncbi:MAG: ATP-binding cassette domain-containing protein, partial [Muribaculaceae bacterium]|nr:ATP-binding cassette domain-containing protein [Muribaculaceae bacterium]